MRPRLPLRARMALIWSVGFFVLGVIMLATVGFLIRQTIDDTPDAVTNAIVTELGLDVDHLTGQEGAQVFSGNLIPAGTAFKPHLEMKVKHLVEAPVPKELAGVREEKEAEAKAEAEAANEAKSNFLSTVSHELRTPLTSVIGFAKIIKKTPNVI